MLTKACVLRSGGDFRAEHVQWLARQVDGLVCLSDVAVPGVQTIPLRSDWPGWWAKMEMFGPSLTGDVLMLDLDTVVRRLPSIPDRTTVLRDFNDLDLIGSGFMFVTQEDRARVWGAWTADPAGHMAANQKWPNWGDQGFLRPHLSDAVRWQDVAKVYSYKKHCQGGLPDDAEVVCFHGKPRPWTVRDGWVPPLSVDTLRNSLGELIQKHAGQRVCVMGGGPALADDVAMVKADVWISSNEHGAKLRAVDYVVAMDTTHTVTGKDMRKHIRAFTDAPIIGPWGNCDYQILKWPHHPLILQSGAVGVWIASLMGAHPVILAGFDCYGGDRKRIADHEKVKPHLHSEVRVCSGPLIGMHPAYRKGERRSAYKPPEAVQTDEIRQGEAVVRVDRRPFTFRGMEWPVGTLLRVSRHEVRMQIKHKSLVEV